jgi:hypothetical protein
MTATSVRTQVLNIAEAIEPLELAAPKEDSPRSSDTREHPHTNYAHGLFGPGSTTAQPNLASLGDSWTGASSVNDLLSVRQDNLD